MTPRPPLSGSSASESSAELLPAAELYHRCDPAEFPFETVAELEDPPSLICQERAVEAVNFAIAMRRRGYNLFVLGPTGTGRHTLVRELLGAKAATAPTPPDLCYVNNFAEPNRPRALSLPPGRAAPLRERMKRLVQELRAALPAAFEKDEYRARRDALEAAMKQRHEEAFGELQKRAEARNIALIRTPIGLGFAPERDGEVLRPEAFKQLPEAEREAIREAIDGFQEELDAILRKIPEWEREHREALRRLNRETTAFSIRHLLDELRRDYADLPVVLGYFQEVEQDIQENADDFLSEPGAGPLASMMPDEPPSFRRYAVKVLVDNGGLTGAPVIYEDHPTHQALVGRIEHLARFGTLMTDFGLLAPGALHRANGGYLILDAEKVLTAPFGWESLKRALRAEEIRIESLEQMLSLASTVSLEPEPIRLDIKLVLVGSALLHHLLVEHDPEFGELFKVAADFDDRVERNPETNLLYARLIAAASRRRGLRPFDRGAVARLIEQASRAAGDRERLSMHIRAALDIVEEADHWAAEAGRKIVTAAEVQEAIDARTRRADRIHRRILEEIARDTLRIDTSGAQEGQVNGLTVLSVGGFAFGHPVRITARARLGRGEIIDIEREVALGGPLHSKGILILCGFLGGRYGRSRPLALTASLVFEQSYGGVEGDSASAAELFALLSSLAQIPLDQSVAVTGSIDQQGRIQAIGGVNEKIEGFFDVCRSRGLDGQGVLIPAANVKHLMLRRDVVEAAAAGKFRIHAMETADQGIELLTGMPAGTADAGGKYPLGSFNHAVMTRLDTFARFREAEEKIRPLVPSPRSRD